MDLNCWVGDQAVIKLDMRQCDRVEIVRFARGPIA